MDVAKGCFQADGQPPLLAHSAIPAEFGQRRSGASEVGGSGLGYLGALMPVTTDNIRANGGSSSRTRGSMCGALKTFDSIKQMKVTGISRAERRKRGLRCRSHPAASAR